MPAWGSPVLDMADLLHRGGPGMRRWRGIVAGHKELKHRDDVGTEYFVLDKIKMDPIELCNWIIYIF